MNNEHVSEHCRITKNTQAIDELREQLSTIEQAISAEISSPIEASKPNYSFVFEANQPCDNSEVALLSNGFIPFSEREKFYRNLTEKSVTVTLTITNKDKEFSMTVMVGGKHVTTVGVGKTVTITVTVPAGKSIKADKVGEYKIDAVK